MFIAIQIILLLFAVLFGLGAIADDDINNRKIYGQISASSLIAIAGIYVATILS